VSKPPIPKNEKRDSAKNEPQATQPAPRNPRKPPKNTDQKDDVDDLFWLIFFDCLRRKVKKEIFIPDNMDKSIVTINEGIVEFVILPPMSFHVIFSFAAVVRKSRLISSLSK